MKNIQNYKEFRLDESSTPFFSKNNYPGKYKDRAKKLYDLPDNPTVLAKVRNFFQKMEDRMNTMAYYGAQYQQMRRAERGGGPNTGIEALFGLGTVVPSVLKKVFGPTRASLVEKNPENKEEYLKFMRHTNEEFVKNDLPRIKDESQLDANISRLYQKGGVKRKESPILDEVARNRANIFYSKQMNQNIPIYQ